MSLLSDAVSAHYDRLRDSASDPVEYERPGVGKVSRVVDGTTFENVLAAFGESVFETTERNGTITLITTHDFIIRQEDLQITGTGVITPERNDIIRKTVGGVAFTYRVLPDFGLPHFRASDNYGKAWRIFGKEAA